MSDPYPWQRSSSGGGYNAGRYYSNYYIVSKDRAAGSAATPDPPHPTKLTAPVYWELLATWCGEVRGVSGMRGTLPPLPDSPAKSVYENCVDPGGSGPLHMRGCGVWVPGDPYILNLSRVDLVLAERVLGAFDLVSSGSRSQFTSE